MDITDDVTCTLRAEAHHPPCVLESAGFCTEESAKTRGIGYKEEQSPTLRAGVVPAALTKEPLVYENHSQDTRYVGPLDIAPTVAATYGTGGNNQPFVLREEAKAYGICSKDSNSMKSDNPHSGIYEADTARTIDGNGGNPGCNQGGIAVVESYAIQGSMIGREDKNGPQGDGINADVSFTLNTVDRHAVYAMTTGSFTQVSENTAPTLLSRDYKDATVVSEPCYGIGRDAFNQGRNAQFSPTFEEELAPTLVAKGPGAALSGYTVRRLTPTECARLQGFPDWWCADLGTENPTAEDIEIWRQVWETHRRITDSSKKPKSDKQIIKWLRDPHSDAAEYKMWGNGVALPNVCFVLSGIVYYAQLSGE